MVANVRQFHRGASLTVIPPTGVGIFVNPLILPVAPGIPNPPQIRIQFSIEKTLSTTPPKATIRVYNMSKLSRDRAAAAVKRTVDFSRAWLLTPDDRLVSGASLGGSSELVTLASGDSYVKLEAGYGGSLSTIFEGNTTRVLSEQRGTDWVTTIEAEDGGLSNKNAVATATFDPGQTALDIVKHVVRTMGYLGGSIPALPPPKLALFPLTYGWTIVDRARDVLDEILKPLDLEWWVDDGELWIVDSGTKDPLTGEEIIPPSTLPGAPVRVSSIPDPTAIQLLETPKRTESDGIMIRCLLSPTIRVGRSVMIVSLELAGLYRCEVVEHQGDNRGGAFETTAYLRTLTPLFLQ